MLGSVDDKNNLRSERMKEKSNIKSILV